MKKFLIYKDYKAGAAVYPGYSYTPIEAENLEEAIEIADQMWREEGDDLYLMRIMKKAGAIVTPYKAGFKYETYEAILCRRSFGWHRNTIENSEGEHLVNKCWLTKDRNDIWYEIEHRAS